MEYHIRTMTVEDYPQVYNLWMSIHKFAMRRAGLYHVCVREDCRKHGIGKAMVTACMRRLQEEKINKVSLVAFRDNEVGNHFWNREGWELREDLNCYGFVLNEENITRFNQ